MRQTLGILIEVVRPSRDGCSSARGDCLRDRPPGPASRSSVLYPIRVDVALAAGRHTHPCNSNCDVSAVPSPDSWSGLAIWEAAAQQALFKPTKQALTQPSCARETRWPFAAVRRTSLKDPIP